MGFEVRTEIPGLEPEAKRALVEVQTAIARECKRLEEGIARPKRRVTEVVQSGHVIAKSGELVRVQPGDEDVTVYLPEPSAANGGEDVVVSVEGDGTATGKVRVEAMNGTCELPGITTLNSPGQYVFTSTGASGPKPGFASAAPDYGATWAAPPPVTNADLPADLAGDGLTGGAGAPLAVGAGDGIDVTPNGIAVDVTDLAGTGLESDGTNNLRIAASAAGAGLTGGGGAALAVGGSTSLIVGADDVQRAALAGGDVTAPQNSNVLTIADNAVTNAKLRDSAALSIIGRSSATSGDPADIAATGGRQFLGTNTAGTAVSFQTVQALFPGAPIYDVMAAPFNAAGNGIADDTAAINAAIAAANAAPGDIYLGERHRITAALTTVTGNNITIRGRGDFNGGSRIIVDSASAIDVLTFTGQYQGVEDVWFVGIRVYTSGWAIRIRNAFRCRASRCVISQLCFGVEVFRSVLTYCDKVNIDDIYGVFAFWAGGDSGGENHAVTFRSCTYGTGMPGGIVGAGSGWAPSTAYSVGAVVTANSGIYQAVQAGTSAASGTGPSGIPGATNATVHTAQVTDNTVRWVFAMPASVGFLQSSYCHTFEMIDCGTLQGLYGFSMEDPANTGGSYPQFARARNLQIDHPTSRGVRLAAGGAARFDSTFVTSVFGGSGIEVGSGFKGNWEFVGGEIFGCSEAGVVINKGDGLLCGMQIGACGSASRDCIEVGNSASRWTITGCSAGQMFASTSPASRYGLSIAAGCDHYVVQGNRFEGNVTGSILNTPGRSSTRAVLNNVPDVTLAAGSTWGLQCDATSPAVPVEITGAEQAENFRRRTVQTVSGVSGNLDIQLDDDATVLLIRTTADATLRTLEDSSGLGDGREIAIEHDRLSGSGDLTVAHNTAGTYAAFFNPNTADVVLGQTTSVLARARSGFWRPQLPASGGLTDGDKGDITVSASGTVWNIDPGVVGTTELATDAVTTIKILNANVTTAKIADEAVTNAKLANMATARFKARVTAGTGDPEDITGTQATTLLDTFTSALKGLAPASGGGTANFLRADGTWTAPPSLTDGDKGDITVSGSGATWNLDAGVVGSTELASNAVTTVKIADEAVTLAKQADLAQSRVIGRAEGAGTGVPQALTPTQVVAVIDAEDATWTGDHTFTGTNAYNGSNTFGGPVRFNDHLRLEGDISATLGAATNNWNPSGLSSAHVIRVTCTNIVALSGLVPPANGAVVHLLRIDTDTDNLFSLLHESGSSSAANRFILPNSSELFISVGGSVSLWYDGTSSRWRVLGVKA